MFRLELMCKAPSQVQHQDHEDTRSDGLSAVPAVTSVLLLRQNRALGEVDLKGESDICMIRWLQFIACLEAVQKQSSNGAFRDQVSSRPSNYAPDIGERIPEGMVLFCIFFWLGLLYKSAVR